MTERVSFSAPAVKRAIATVRKSGEKIRCIRFPPEGGFDILTGEPIEAPIPDRSGREVIAL